MEVMTCVNKLFLIKRKLKEALDEADIPKAYQAYRELDEISNQLVEDVAKVLSKQKKTSQLYKEGWSRSSFGH